jgi:hypothetical protein
VARPVAAPGDPVGAAGTPTAAGSAGSSPRSGAARVRGDLPARCRTSSRVGRAAAAPGRGRDGWEAGAGRRSRGGRAAAAAWSRCPVRERPARGLAAPTPAPRARPSAEPQVSPPPGPELDRRRAGVQPQPAPPTRPGSRSPGPGRPSTLGLDLARLLPLEAAARRLPDPDRPPAPHPGPPARPRREPAPRTGPGPAGRRRSRPGRRAGRGLTSREAPRYRSSPTGPRPRGRRPPGPARSSPRARWAGVRRAGRPAEPGGRVPPERGPEVGPTRVVRPVLGGLVGDALAEGSGRSSGPRRLPCAAPRTGVAPSLSRRGRFRDRPSPTWGGPIPPAAAGG